MVITYDYGAYQTSPFSATLTGAFHSWSFTAGVDVFVGQPFIRAGLAYVPGIKEGVGYVPGSKGGHNYSPEIRDGGAA